MNKNKKISESLKKYHAKRKTKTQQRKEIKILLWLIFIVSVLGFYKEHNQWSQLVIEAKAPYAWEHNTFPIAKDKENLSVVDKIVIEWTKAGHPLPLEEAYDIADCESKVGKFKRNHQGSSASGVYMFINKTWDNYCDGYRMNDEDNIRCFMKLYPKNKEWWACTSIMGYL